MALVMYFWVGRSQAPTKVEEKKKQAEDRFD